MIRLCVATVLFALVANTAAAQVVWNPNSARARRDLQANPPPPPPVQGQVGDTFDAEKWGTHSRPVRQPQWNTLGGSGWTGGSTSPTLQPPR